MIQIVLVNDVDDVETGAAPAGRRETRELQIKKEILFEMSVCLFSAENTIGALIVPLFGDNENKRHLCLVGLNVPFSKGHCVPWSSGWASVGSQRSPRFWGD